MVLCVSPPPRKLAAFSVDLSQFYQAGLEHSHPGVRQQFLDSIQIAQQALREQATESMVAAAVLYRPCQMLANRCFSSESWTSDSLIESGTLDWLVELAGEEIAEVIRLQPHTRRYLVSINASHYRRLNDYERQQIRCDGGELSWQARVAFARGRYFSQAMQLVRWIDQVSSLKCR